MHGTGQGILVSDTGRAAGQLGGHGLDGSGSCVLATIGEGPSGGGGDRWAGPSGWPTGRGYAHDERLSGGRDYGDQALEGPVAVALRPADSARNPKFVTGNCQFLGDGSHPRARSVRGHRGPQTLSRLESRFVQPRSTPHPDLYRCRCDSRYQPLPMERLELEDAAMAPFRTRTHLRHSGCPLKS